MTVKLSKFFTGGSSTSSSHSTSINASSNPPPLPPPNPNIYDFYAQQIQQQKMAYKAYMMDEEDTMSVYSQTQSIMTSRDHPFNNSQRPLLARSSTSNNNNQKGKKKNANNNNNINQITVQQQNYDFQHHTGKPHQHPELDYAKPYVSPYVQQQKRDSAKGLHGFNDFDILSQQYTQHLQSPHIGYPYGSPPSPTTVGASDFVFEPMRVPGQGAQSQPSNWLEAGGPASRFEDDFCTRRNEEFAKESTTPTLEAQAGGPFIFGVPPEQQLHQIASRMPPGGRGFNDDCVVSVINDSLDEKYTPLAAMTASDTSSSSRDDRLNRKGSKFLLLRKSKSRKIKKDKAKEAAAAATKGKDLESDGATATNNKKPTIKCVLVGDGAVGKTNLIMSYLENRFNPEHVPTASDIYNADVMVNDSPVNLTLCDTAGQDTLDPLRELCYPDSNVFLLCFSVTKPDTFEAIKTKWAPKFSKTKAALILVGTQADLRTNQKVLNKLQISGEKPISYADAVDLATSIGAKYIETSSATQEKVKDLFDTAIWEGLAPSTLPPTPPLWKKLLCLA